MKEHNTREDQIKVVFGQYPQTDDLFMTSDNRIFFDSPRANAHAQQLSDGRVVSVHRTMLESDKALKQALALQTEPGAPAKEQEPAKAISEMTVAELKAELDKLEVEYSKSWTKDTLVETLEAAVAQKAEESGAEETVAE